MQIKRFKLSYNLNKSFLIKLTNCILVLQNNFYKYFTFNFYVQTNFMVLQQNNFNVFFGSFCVVSFLL